VAFRFFRCYPFPGRLFHLLLIRVDTRSAVIVLKYYKKVTLYILYINRCSLHFSIIFFPCFINIKKNNNNNIISFREKILSSLAHKRQPTYAVLGIPFHHQPFYLLLTRWWVRGVDKNWILQSRKLHRYNNGTIITIITIIIIVLNIVFYLSQTSTSLTRYICFKILNSCLLNNAQLVYSFVKCFILYSSYARKDFLSMCMNGSLL